MQSKYNISKRNHIPLRMCVICKKRMPKDELIRYVKKQANGVLIEDKKQTLSGRGRYVCTSKECQKRFINCRLKK